MSTITIVPRTYIARPLPERDRGAALRLTRRGRLVLLAGFLATIALLMVVLGGLATGTRDSGTPEPTRTIEVGPGDTLYAIAGTVAAPGHVREMVAHLEQLNALSGPELQVGQRIAVPLH
jgi:hypothetical protein